MKHPVSVVLAVKNGARFIEQALESVISENVFEIIVVDDHSTDDSMAIAQSVLLAADPHAGYLLLSSPPDRHGVGPARDIGLAHAAMPYVALIDADDVWLPGKTAKQLAALQESGFDPGHAYGATKVEHFVSDGFDIPATLRADKLGTIDLFFPSNLVCHRDLFFKTVGGFDPELVCANDVDWYYRAHKLGVERVHVDEVLVRKRVHDDNLSLCQGHDMQRQILNAICRKVTPNMFPIVATDMQPPQAES